MRRDFRRTAAAAQDSDIGVAADDGDALESLGQRQHVVGILQQHDRLLRHALRHGGVGVVVDIGRRGGMIHHALVEQRAQDAMHHVLKARLRNGARLHGLGEWRCEIGFAVELFAVFLIEAVVRSHLGGMRAAPIRHDEARPCPIAFERLVQEVVVLAGIDAAHFVVGAHDRARRTGFDGELEGEKIGFARGRRIDLHVGDEPARLLVVQRIMLERRNRRSGSGCPRSRCRR